MSLAALPLGALALWSLALAHALWQAVRLRRLPTGRRTQWSARQHWRWRALRRHGAAQSLRLAGRLYVAVGSGGSLPRSLAVLIAAEPDGPLRQALQLRLRHLQRRAPASRLPRWRGMPLAPCPPALRVLDDLLAGRATAQQAMADWRIELLCSRVASCRAYRRADKSPLPTARRDGAGDAGVATRGQQLQRASGAAHRRNAGAPSHRSGGAGQ